MTQGQIVNINGEPFNYASDSVPVGDSLRSLIGNLGDPTRDKNASLVFDDNIIGDHQLSAAYRGNWIARKIVDIPARDALRKWRVWGGEDREKIEAEEKRLRVQTKMLEAMTKGRLFGGAAIYIGTEQDPSMPFEPESVGLGGIKYLTVLSKRELLSGDIEHDPLSEFYGKPKHYVISGETKQANIHPSRVCIFNGDSMAESWISGGVNAGWSESVLKATYDTIKNAGGTFSNIASLVFEANVDVIGVPGLMSQVGSQEYEGQVLKRFALAAQGKGINGTLILDAEETYNRRAASFAQLPEIMREFAMHCAAGADIPATRFLAQSPGGLQSTGDSDMNNYHDRLGSMQKLDIEPSTELLDKALVVSAGASESTYEWAPFEQLSDTELSTLGKTISETLKELDDMGILTPEELRELAIHRLGEVGAFPHIKEVTKNTDFQLQVEPEPEDEFT